MEISAKIREWCHMYESHQGQINHLEWFLGRDPNNQALAQKIYHLKEQSHILVELIRAELRPETQEQSAA